MENDKTKEITNQELQEPLFLLIKDLKNKIDNLELKTDKILEIQQYTPVKENEFRKSVSNEKELFRELTQQFEKIDSLLGKYFQKFSRDNKRLFERMNSIENAIENMKEQPIPKRVIEGTRKITRTPPRPTVEARDYINSLPVKEDFNQDKHAINELKLFFLNKNVFTTGAIKTIEESRDKLLFERDTEAPYRAFAAKIFREILGIIKSEKDFSTLTTQASKDIIHRLDLLSERI